MVSGNEDRTTQQRLSVGANLKQLYRYIWYHTRSRWRQKSKINWKDIWEVIRRLKHNMLYRYWRSKPIRFTYTLHIIMEFQLSTVFFPQVIGVSSRRWNISLLFFCFIVKNDKILRKTSFTCIVWFFTKFIFWFKKLKSDKYILSWVDKYFLQDWKIFKWEINALRPCWIFQKKNKRYGITNTLNTSLKIVDRKSNIYK